MTTVALFIIHRTKPGKRNEVEGVWLRHMAPAIQANPGHLAYFYSLDAADPDSICAFQHDASAEAAQEFLEHLGYLRYLQEVNPLLEGPPQVKNLIPKWIKAAD